jgi:hypothetical protein
MKEPEIAGIVGQILLQSHEAPVSAPEAGLEGALQECIHKLRASSTTLVELRYESALNFTQIASAVGRTGFRWRAFPPATREPQTKTTESPNEKNEERKENIYG